MHLRSWDGFSERKLAWNVRTPRIDVHVRMEEREAAYYSYFASALCGGSAGVGGVEPV